MKPGRVSTLSETVKILARFDFEKSILQVVSLNDEKALNLNRDVQLFDEGSDSKGELLTPPYADVTVFLKGLAGQPSNRVTLRDTEDFHNSFFMDTSKFPVKIDAADSKTSELKEEYGDDIFGLDEDSLKEFGEFILPDIQDANKKGIGL